MKLSGGILKQPVSELAPYLILICIGVILFSVSGRDDAYITYWPAHTLSQSGHILNYNGDFVEQSSSLLQVLILAFWEKNTGLSQILLGRIFSLLFGLLTLTALSAFSKKIIPAVKTGPVLLTATSVFFIYWSFSGMETTLAACCTLLVIMSMGDYIHASKIRPSSLLLPSVFMLFYVLTRPENMFIALAGLTAMTGLLIMLYWIRKERPVRQIINRILQMAGITVLISLAVIIFRKVYFSSYFPQPVTAKLNPGRQLLSGRDLESCVHYFQKTISLDWSIVLLSGISTICVCYMIWRQIGKNRSNAHTGLLLSFLLAGLGFIFFSTGDWMEGGRFFVHVLPLAVFSVPFSLFYLKINKKWFTVIFSLLIIVQGRSVYTFAKNKSLSVPVWEKLSVPGKYHTSSRFWFETRNLVHARDIPLSFHLEKTISRCLAVKQDTLIILTGQMGMTAFHITQQFPHQIRFMDHFALTESGFTDCSKTNGLYRNRTGLRLTYDQIFNIIRHPCKTCEFKKPDIIYDLEKPGRISSIQHNGFTVVFHQKGNISFHPSWHSEPANAFIAVNNDLLAAFPDQKSEMLDFSRFPRTSD